MNLNPEPPESKHPLGKKRKAHGRVSANLFRGTIERGFYSDIQPSQGATKQGVRGHPHRQLSLPRRNPSQVEEWLTPPFITASLKVGTRFQQGVLAASDEAERGRAAHIFTGFVAFSLGQ